MKVKMGALGAKTRNSIFLKDYKNKARTKWVLGIEHPQQESESLNVIP